MSLFPSLLMSSSAFIAHGDFNGDGKVDLIAAGSPSIYQYPNYIFWGNGDGTFRDPVLVNTPSLLYLRQPPFFDYSIYAINKDGKSDILSTNETSVAPEVSQIAFGSRTETAHSPVSYTHLRAHETGRNLVCRL